MKPIDIKKHLNYAMGVVFIALGIAILVGWVKFKTGGPGMKNIFGAVLILYGFYRFSAKALKSLPSKRDHSRFFSILFLVCILGISGCAKNKKMKEPKETVTSGKLTVIVSESHKRLFELEASEFMRYYKETHVTVLGASTREAIVHLLNDSVKVVVTDRRLNEEEREVARKAEINLEEFPVAEDAFAVLVNKVNSLEVISQKTLRSILTGRINRWNQLPSSDLNGSIAIVMTGRNSGAYELIKNLFFQIDGGLQFSVLSDSQDEILETTAKTANAIGLVSLACFKDTASQSAGYLFSEKVKPLAFSGIDSTTGESTEFQLHQANVYRGNYPFHYSVFMIQNLENAPLAKGFITFVCSNPGQKIFLNWGLVPKKVPIRLVQITQE